ncbi:hypothetical protein [Streptomyces benahoarensis]|uniref:Uncharacterized protein n=1 Tax=Streptomyces benahoarensis TaxID=2595054 RepID=A0A553YVL8_9ACTN|nr:hypothetical protein [Streptomyces benahoarensis]TSB20680.1 hypothetical protein FNJ62_20580 [Streptomyces benahoarensis]TSB33261.1 hypothetical protein FNZ23_23970 [Streptomyces benahoarensis]
MSVTVSGFEWRHVPLRLDVERWATRKVRKKILAVVHTVTAGQRLLDAVRLLDGDPRVQVIFTVAPDVFSHGVEAFLEGTRALVLPWAQAVNIPFDLALAASHGSLHELHAPVIVLPHGVGHNKVVSSPAGHATPAAGPAERGVYGLSRQRLVRDGAVIPAAIVLSHAEELARLGRECPEAVPAAHVVGDPCYDRIRASMPSRALYRKALRTGAHQELLLACSTWGPQSLLGEEWELLERLAADLPRDEYSIALMLHPNVWNAHGEWQIKSWLTWLGRSGVQVISQYSDWCGAVAASDIIVGDHGSAALYGTMTGARVLTTGSAKADLDPGSPMAELRSFAPRLRADRPLRRQLRAPAAAARPELYARVAARLTSEPGRFARRMRSLIYRTLRLRAPAARLVPETASLPVTLDFRVPGGAET